MYKEFEAQLQKGDNPVAWTCVVIDDAAELFGTRGLVKIRGEIDGEPFDGALMAQGDGTHRLPVKASLRKTIGKQAGDIVHVRIDERIGWAALHRRRCVPGGAPPVPEGDRAADSDQAESEQAAGADARVAPVDAVRGRRFRRRGRELHDHDPRAVGCAAARGHVARVGRTQVLRLGGRFARGLGERAGRRERRDAGGEGESDGV